MLSEGLMSEALSDADLSPWEPTNVVRGRVPRLQANALALASLPAMQPGQLWYVQLASTEPALAPLEYRALTTANVVIYDAALAPIVAGSLPLGGYAELAAPRDRAVERCLRFASEGWSVARLVDSKEGWIDGLRQLSQRLLPASTAAVMPVSVIVNTDGSYKKIETELSELVDVAERVSLEPPVAMTIILDRIAAGTAPRFAVAAANGLAG
jgi:hypothetical protein